jgi:cytochrome c553
MKSLILAVALLAGSACGAWAQGASGAPPELIKTCESCHGPGGNGDTPSTPRLNGQLSAYIVNRLRELSDLTRNSMHATLAMHDIAQMKDSLKAEVADYFSHQPPTPAQPQPGKLAAMGERLYANGDSADQIPPCQSCHGAHAEGQGMAPRLAGQHRDYLKTQLWDFNFVMRENATMHPNAMKLSADQIDALVAYLGSD